jgi:hypothetical protein
MFLRRILLLNTDSRVIAIDTDRQTAAGGVREPAPTPLKEECPLNTPAVGVSHLWLDRRLAGDSTATRREKRHIRAGFAPARPGFPRPEKKSPHPAGHRTGLPPAAKGPKDGASSSEPLPAYAARELLLDVARINSRSCTQRKTHHASRCQHGRMDKSSSFLLHHNDRSRLRIRLVSHVSGYRFRGLAGRDLTQTLLYQAKQHIPAHGTQNTEKPDLRPISQYFRTDSRQECSAMAKAKYSNKLRIGQCA